MQAKQLFLLTGITLLTHSAASAQDNEKSDTSRRSLEEVVVTATRSERKLSNIAVPVTIIPKQIIQQSGSVRLHDILSEQTGLFMTSSFGKGVQVQGLNPDYTLILIDGEPVVGRNGGVLDLSRITVSGIRKIEIVKGPSSSLYGSEALAGVINIITDRPAATSANASIRYGSFNTSDISAGAGWVTPKLNISANANSYRSDGYTVGNGTAATQDPFHNYTFGLKSVYNFTAATKWLISARYFTEKQETKAYTMKDANNDARMIEGDARQNDININNSLEHRFSATAKTALRIYYTKYKAVTDQTTVYSNPVSTELYHDYFQQWFLRFEDQTDWKLNKSMDLTVGGGWITDNVRSNRYDEQLVTRRNGIGYLFTQYDWSPGKTWNIIAGLRYDHNQQYASRLSPKLAVQKRFSEKFRVNASIGSGFKAPDFRQLYLNFTNGGVGYTVLGNTEVQAGMQRLQSAGQIQSIMIDPATIKPLEPETSTGINIGAHYSFSSRLGMEVNFFRNDIRNLIVTGLVAQKTNNQFVYSYFNVNKAYTQGAEVSVKWQIFPALQLQGGYQLLFTADKDQLKKIKAGTEFGRDNGVVYKLTKKDYDGLFNRSRHMGNLKIFYSANKGWFANARATYRSGWGFGDTDGNLYLNRGDQFASDLFQVNVSAGKSFRNGLKLQAGSDNFFNYKNAQYTPELPGRIVYITCSFSFTHQHTNK